MLRPILLVLISLSMVDTLLVRCFLPANDVADDNDGPVMNRFAKKLLRYDHDYLLWFAISIKVFK